MKKTGWRLSLPIVILVVRRARAIVDNKKVNSKNTVKSCALVK